MTGLIRTVLGDVPSDTLGVTDSHEHLFLRTPLLPGQELEDVRDAEAQAAAFAAAGGRTIVQWTPAGLGRHLAELRRISVRTGVTIVAATGRHRRQAYSADAPIALLDRDGLVEVFVRDLTERDCGFVKIGTGPDGPSAFERESLLAAAHASVLTGVPIAIHLEHGSGADPVIDLLAGEGVDPSRIVLGHLGRAPDPGVVLDAAASGAWICLDIPSPVHGTTPDGLGARIERLATAGFAHRLLLGTDTTTSSVRARRLSISALLELTVPGLAPRLTPELAGAALRVNPAFAWARTYAGTPNDIGRFSVRTIGAQDSPAQIEAGAH